MRLIRRSLLAAFAFMVLTLPLAAADLKNEIYLDTKDGRVTILLRPDLAPKTVAQIKALTKRGFYNGLKFHRVIEGFMAQTGDPTGTGTGGSDLPNVPAEFSKAHFKRGSVGMARADDPEFRQFAILHLFRRGWLPRWAIYALRPGDRRHGCRRQDQEGLASRQRHRHRPRQDRKNGAGDGRREIGVRAGRSNRSRIFRPADFLRSARWCRRRSGRAEQADCKGPGHP